MSSSEVPVLQPAITLAWMQKLVGVLPVGICWCDPEGRCIYVNGRWCELTGRTDDEVLGESWEEVVHPDDRQRVRESWAVNRD